MSNPKKIVKTIAIVVLIICIICISLLYILKQQENNTDTQVTEGDTLNVEYVTEKLRDPTTFFAIEDYIQKDFEENFVAKEMNVLSGERIDSYAVCGEKTDEVSNNVQKMYFIFRIDIENMTYDIEALNESYNNINEINLNTNIQEIQNDGSNSFEAETVTSEQMCRIYLEDFTQLELNNIEEAYNLIDEEYRKERFPTIQEYQEYVEGYREVIQTGVLYQYSADYKDDYTEYILVNNYGTSYTVRETSIMNYTIMLDNYTIKVDTYEEDYNKLSDENKVQSNVYIFLQMLNTKDYEHAYELLDNTFKNNNFDTLDKFEEYINQNFFNFNHNSTDVDITQEGEYYIYESTIRNNGGSAAESKKLTVIMQLLNSTDFVMSFSIENILCFFLEYFLGIVYNNINYIWRNNMIEIKDISKSYKKGKKVVDNMNLTINNGEIFGFLGPNGAGKTTTINMITGILEIDDGDILIDGNSIITSPVEAKKMIGFVSDSPDVFLKLKGIEYLNFIADMYEVPTDERNKKIEELSKEFEIYDVLGDKIQSYSHGMRQKIIIVSVLLHNPKNWILDEPLTGLDPKSSFNLKNKMREHVKKGNTVFFSTHILEIAEKLCDRIGVIDQGKLLFVGTIEEMKKEFKGNATLEELFMEITKKDEENI